MSEQKSTTQFALEAPDGTLTDLIDIYENNGLCYIKAFNIAFSNKRMDLINYLILDAGVDPYLIEGLLKSKNLE